MPNIWYITAMSGIERETGRKNNFDPVDILARYLSGKIKREDLNENDSMVIEYYRGVMLDDPSFDSEVKQRLTELSSNTSEIEGSNTIEVLAQNNLGRIKRSDLSCEVRERVESLQKESEENSGLEKQIIIIQNKIALMPVHKPEKKKRVVKKKKKGDHFYVQSSLLPPNKNADFGLLINDKSDLEEEVDKIGETVNSRYGGRWDDELKKEVEYKKNELRKIIGLPVAKRSSGNENNMFYRFLVRRVIAWDVFGIFGDYCSSTSGVTVDLESKIRQVTETLHVLLSKDSGLNLREKFRYFDSFLQEYRQKWG